MAKTSAKSATRSASDEGETTVKKRKVKSEKAEETVEAKPSRTREAASDSAPARAERPARSAEAPAPTPRPSPATPPAAAWPSNLGPPPSSAPAPQRPAPQQPNWNGGGQQQHQSNGGGNGGEQRPSYDRPPQQGYDRPPQSQGYDRPQPQNYDRPQQPQQNYDRPANQSGGGQQPNQGGGGGYQNQGGGGQGQGQGQGGGGGYQQQRPYQHQHQQNQGGGMQPMQGGMQGPGGRRKKKKKRGGMGGMPGMPGMPTHGGGGGMGGGGGSGHIQHLVSQGLLPSDDEIEREAQALERIAGTPDYAEAEKKALHMSELQRMEIGKLHELAEKEGLVEFHKLPRQELIFQLLKKKAADTGLIFGEGTLDIAHEGYAFLRSPEQSYLSSPDDIYVAPAMVRRMGLRKGMEIKGAIRPPKDNERYFTLLRIDAINGQDPKKARMLPIFEDLTPLHPEQRYVLETSPDEIEMRIVDLVAPIGRGQRGLIVAPPRTGKTVLLQKITQAISKNFPEVKIIVLLIDERPEEVTDFRRNTNPTVEVVASTFDEDSSRHVAVAEMVIEKARRYVEFGQHVVILLDSITRLARAYNANSPHSGKIMTGGIDSNALTRPKKFFGSARAIERGGSLTILGTALVDTGSKADEVIFEEFKGTGNSELHLDRKLVDKRIWPAIDVAASGTRREELLLDKKELELTYRLRKVLSDMNVVEAMELMKSRLKKCKTNAEFLVTMNLGA